jgi:hypothetical protein
MMERKIYLAYGSNLNQTQMTNRCPTAKLLGASTLKDYQLLFRGGNGGAVATVEPLKGASVPVLLWEITPADEAALDRYEGWPFLYRKEAAKVKFGRKNIETMVYILNEGRPLASPSCYYYSVILEGYNVSEFDIGVLKQAVKNSTGEDLEDEW